MTTETNEQQFLTLRGLHISLPPNEAIARLTELFPRAYNLRKSIAACIPILTEDGVHVLYEIHQDCEDHYPRIQYVTYHNGHFTVLTRESNQHKARVIDKHGIFVVVEEAYARHDIYLITFKGEWKKIAQFDEDRKNRLSEVTQLRLSEHGLYVFWTERPDAKMVGYVSSEDFNGYVPTIEPLPIPNWVDLDAIQPGTQAGTTYFADASVIWCLNHETGDSQKACVARDVYVRFTECTWKPYIAVGQLFPLFLFTSKHSHNNYLSDGKQLPYDMYYNDESRCVQCGQGFVALDVYVNNDVQLRYTYPEESRWKQPKTFYKGRIGNWDTPVLLRKGNNELFFYGVAGQWWQVPLKFVLDVL